MVWISTLALWGWSLLFYIDLKKYTTTRSLKSDYWFFSGKWVGLKSQFGYSHTHNPLKKIRCSLSCIHFFLFGILNFLIQGFFNGCQIHLIHSVIGRCSGRMVKVLPMFVSMSIQGISRYFLLIPGFWEDLHQQILNNQIVKIL